MNLTRLEDEVLRLLLAGDHPVLELLRQQASACRVVDRELTGVGFYTSLEVPLSVASIRGNPGFTLGDVYATVEGMANPVGFLLFVRDGKLGCLEGYSHEEPWSVGEAGFELSYDMKGKDRDFQKLLSKLPPVATDEGTRNP